MRGGGLVNRLARGASSTTLLSSVGLMLLTAVTGVLSARLLSVSDRGTLSATLAVTSLLSFVALAGATEATVLAPRRGVDPRSVGTVAWSWSVLLGAVSSGVVFAYLHVVGTPSLLFTLLACVTPVLGTLGALTNYELVRLGRYRTAALLRLSPVIVQVVLIIAFALLNRATLTTLMFASVFGSAVAGIISLIAIDPRSRWTIRVRRRDAASVLRVGARTGFAQLGRALSSRCDLVIVSVLLGSTASGLLSVAASLSVAATSLIASLAPVLLARSEGANAAAVSAASALTWGLALFIAAAGPFIVPLIYGEDYSGLFPMLATLAGAMVASTHFELLSRLLQAAGMEHIVWRSTFVSLVIQVGVVVSISTWGSVQYVPVGALLGYAFAFGALIFGTGGESGRRLAKLLNPLRFLEAVRFDRPRAMVTDREDVEVSNGNK